MRILYKSSTHANQLKDRINKGNRKMELHMVADDVNDVEATYRRIIESGSVVYVVHMPIDFRYNIEASVNHHGREIIRGICKIAQMLSEYYGHTIDIVMHPTLELWQSKEWGIYGRIMSFVDELLHRFSNIKLNLENTSPYVMQGNTPILANAYYSSPVDIANELRKDLKTDRVGVVFDVCHSLNSIAHNQAAIRNGILDEWTIKDHFTMYLPLMNVLHLSNTRNWGLKKDHGIGFDTDEDVELLYWILDELMAANYLGVVTLELMEEDLLDAKNQERLYKQVKEYMYKKSH